MIKKVDAATHKEGTNGWARPNAPTLVGPSTHNNRQDANAMTKTGGRAGRSHRACHACMDGMTSLLTPCT